MRRTLAHSRTVRFDGYSRSDGLWDIEAEITDSKSYQIVTLDNVRLAPGEPIHQMRLRLTVDDSLTVLAVETLTMTAPFGECRAAVPPMSRMVGVQMGRGWRQAIETRLGGIQGCTHLRELLFNMATAAFQTIPHYREHVQKRQSPPDQPPAFLGGCMSWDVNGPVTQRVLPQFFGWAPVTGPTSGR